MMLNGKYSQEEMIKSVDKGIFAVSFGGGQVDTDLSLSFPIVTIPAGIQQEITAITFDCLPSATPGAEIAIDFSDQLGDPQILLVASVIGQDQFLVPFSGLITVFEEPPPPPGPSFVRGDANGDGWVDLWLGRCAQGGRRHFEPL